ncbi:MAG: lipoyl synthase [Candidatus Helarchaeota archaeon]|nr:lipoyl synthase [Candidatus Helarchaeota archaeon]
MQKPDWLKVNINLNEFEKVSNLLKRLNLNVVCYHAACPNIGECFAKHTATFLILGDTCTRNCAFCSIKKGDPLPPDPNEPKNIAQAVKELKIKHAVITSVTRDDLPDFGASQFVKTIKSIRNLQPKTTIEVLIPDFNGSLPALESVVGQKPELINHNLETIPRLYSEIRPQANYKISLDILKQVKRLNSKIYTKSGIMVGLGETEEEIIHLMKDLRKVNCAILTIGQYLQPSKEQIEVVKYVNPSTFQNLKSIGESLGFLYVNSGPFVRSSFNAEDISNKIIQ